jgi:hypothetical protein
LIKNQYRFNRMALISRIGPMLVVIQGHCKLNDTAGPVLLTIKGVFRFFIVSSARIVACTATHWREALAAACGDGASGAAVANLFLFVHSPRRRQTFPGHPAGCCSIA